MFKPEGSEEKKLWDNKLTLFNDLAMFLGLEMSGISVIGPEGLARLASEGQLESGQGSGRHWRRNLMGEVKILN